MSVTAALRPTPAAAAITRRALREPMPSAPYVAPGCSGEGHICVRADGRRIGPGDPSACWVAAQRQVLRGAS